MKIAVFVLLIHLPPLVSKAAIAYMENKALLTLDSRLRCLQAEAKSTMLLMPVLP